MPPSRQSRFEVNVSDDIAILLSSIALNLMNINVYHQAVDTILAKKGLSLLSFGELIEVCITPIRTNKSMVTITSKSGIPITLIDWGTNAANIQRFEQVVKQLINLVMLLEKQKA